MVRASTVMAGSRMNALAIVEPRRAASLAILLVVGCHSSSEQASLSAGSATAATASLSCGRVAEHLAGILLANAEKLDKLGGPRGSTTAPIVLRVIADRCGQDHWSEDAKTCALALTPTADWQMCEAKLTGEQLERVLGAVNAEFQVGSSDVPLVITTPSARADSVPASPPALSSYVGKDPREDVHGVSFLHHPAVLTNVRKAVPAGSVRDWVLSVDDVAAVPISESSGWLVAHFCEQHMCGPHQWSILINPAASTAEVCYHDAETTGDNKSRWYYASGQTELRDADATTGGCPGVGG